MLNLGTTILIYSTLPDGTQVAMTGDNNAFIDLLGGSEFVADFGNAGLISLGNGNSTLFAVGSNNVIQMGSGSQVLVAAGDNNVISVGDNSSATTPTFVSVGSSANLKVGGGTNWIYATGSDIVQTGSGTDVIYAVASSTSGVGPNNEMFILGGGQQWTYTTGNLVTIEEGAGTNSNFAYGTKTTFDLNVYGGSTYVTDANSSDTISLADILKGLNLNASLTAAQTYMSLSEATGTAGETDTFVTVKGTQGTATVDLIGIAATSVSDLATKMNFIVPF